MSQERPPGRRFIERSVISTFDGPQGGESATTETSRNCPSNKRDSGLGAVVPPSDIHPIFFDRLRNFF
jgi:hypothetical protein